MGQRREAPWELRAGRWSDQPSLTAEQRQHALRQRVRLREHRGTGLLQAVEDVRKAIEPVAQNLLFSIDDDTGRTIVKVVDAQTDEVIRQMPSEEVLAISKAIDKLKGVLIQQKA